MNFNRLFGGANAPRTPAEWAKHEKKRHHAQFLSSYVGGQFIEGRV